MTRPEIPKDNERFCVGDDGKTEYFRCESGEWVGIDRLAGDRRKNCVNEARCWWLDEEKRLMDLDNEWDKGDQSTPPPNMKLLFNAWHQAKAWAEWGKG